LEEAGLVKPAGHALTGPPAGAVAAMHAAAERPAERPLSMFAALTAQADHVVEGFTLQKIKSNLVNVPFVIINTTFRDGIMRQVKGQTEPRPTNYLSLELYVADAPTLARHISMGRLAASIASQIVPDEALVINDGSTGIARQVTRILHLNGKIEVPEGDEVGPMGQSRYDTYRMDWLRGQNTEGDTEVPFIIACPRGLRVSDYESDYNPDGGSTYYIA
jgi:hypothetical protein